jgi:hypothetical protein
VQAAPLPSIAALVAPMSHSACHPVAESVLVRRSRPECIAASTRGVRAHLDLCRPRTLSGIDMALDLWGACGAAGVDVAGYRKAYPKLPYASVLFGDAAGTLAYASDPRAAGSARRFGWGPGAGSAKGDADHDGGARARTAGPTAGRCRHCVGRRRGARRAPPPALIAAKATCSWSRSSPALEAYAQLRKTGAVRLAGGEAHDFWMARQMIDHAGIGFVQIDAGRIGGLTDAKRGRLCGGEGRYLRHPHSSKLALSASIQLRPQADEIAEYPMEAKPVARAITVESIDRGADGLIRLSMAPASWHDGRPGRFKPYLVDVEIKVGGRVLYRTPEEEHALW